MNVLSRLSQNLAKFFRKSADSITREGAIMDIVIGRAAYINKDASKENVPFYGKGKEKRKDRRKNKKDRRKCVRDGVFVTLSFKEDRRVLKDRRKAKNSS
jgi:hypothetical protein